METAELIDSLITILGPLLPFIIGLYRYKSMDESYHPFVWIMGCAVLSETFRTFQLINYYEQLNWAIGVSTIGYNFYVLAIGIGYTILFYRWGLFLQRSNIMYGVLALLVTVWLLDHFVFEGYRLTGATKKYRLLYSLLLCLFAITYINKLIVREKHNLLRNASFLICLCVLFFFIPYIIMEGVFMFRPKTSPDFFVSVYKIRNRFNPIIYLIFTIAALWIPPKKPFIQLS